MKAKALPQQIIFDQRRYTKRIQGLILAKAEELNCKPSEAVLALLDELARRTLNRKETA